MQLESDMLFSILIPVFNSAKYLDECIRSILNQSEQDYEILFCDDASTDGSLALCRGYAKKHSGKIKLLQHKENQGLLLTRRHLFAEASGRYIFCVDADDQIDHNALSVLKEIILQTKADMILFNALCIHADQRVEHFKPALIPNHLYEASEKMRCYEALFENYYMNSLCTKVFRRELVDFKTNYTPWKNLSCGEDLFQSLPLIDQVSNIYYLDQDLYRYYKREGSITSSANPDFYIMRRMSWEREDQYLISWQLDRDVLKKCQTKRCNEIINYLIRVARDQNFDSFSKEIQLIRRDKFFFQARKNASLSGRYDLYGWLLLNNKGAVLYATMKSGAFVSTMIQGLKRKHSKSKRI